MTPAKLRAWRKRTFISVEEAAAWYGCTRRAWYYWEAGTRPIPRSLKNMVKLSTKTGTLA